MNKLNGELFIFRIIKTIVSRNKIIIIHRESLKKYNIEFIVRNRFTNLDIEFFSVNFNYFNKTIFENNNDNLIVRISNFIIHRFPDITKLIIINSHLLYNDSIMDNYNNDLKDNIAYNSKYEFKNYITYYIGNMDVYYDSANKIKDDYDFNKYLKFKLIKFNDFDIIENEKNINFFDLNNISKKLRINFGIEEILFTSDWKPIVKNIKKVNRLYSEGHYIILTSCSRNKFSYFETLYPKNENSDYIIGLLILNNVNYDEIHFSMPVYDIIFNRYNINQNISGNFLKEKTYTGNNNNNICNIPCEYTIKTNKVVTGTSFKNLLDNDMVDIKILKKCLEIIEISILRHLVKNIDDKNNSVKLLFQTYYTELLSEIHKKRNIENWILNKLDLCLKEHLETIKYTTCNLDNFSLKDIVYYNSKIKFNIRNPKRFINKFEAFSDSYIAYARLLYNILIHENGEKLFRDFMILISPSKRSSIKFLTSLILFNSFSDLNFHYEIAINLICSF